MEYAPDIDVIVALDVKHDAGIALQDATAQTGETKLIGRAPTKPMATPVPASRA